jgi:diaminohydroxyphosphoribosylaminopyrimidine deaminase / 5-amino-6-(5-phosphoribosylamino)uracil reductase
MDWSVPMLAALRAARKGFGNTGPNPLVGAVVLKSGAPLATGYHRRVGDAHAEAAVLQELGEVARGGDLVVSLEPCSHFGRTPPCVDRIIAAGIKRVAVGVMDPNPRERGRGISLLRAAGIEVILGVEEEKCRKINEPYFKFMATGRPFVTLKLATSLDGRIATRSGDSNWFSGPETNRFTHRLRRDSNAIMVGGRTAALDDPSLTVRNAQPLTRPLRVVLSTNLELPTDLQLFKQQEELPTLIFAGNSAPKEREEAFLQRGVFVERVVERESGLDLNEILERLGARGVARLLVDGGGHLAGALLHASLLDRLIVAYAPVVVGADGAASFAFEGVEQLADVRRFALEWTRRSGSDVLSSWRLGPEYWQGVP